MKPYLLASLIFLPAALAGCIDAGIAITANSVKDYVTAPAPSTQASTPAPNPAITPAAPSQSPASTPAQSPATPPVDSSLCPGGAAHCIDQVLCFPDDGVCCRHCGGGC